jgi:hypothetical protein
MAVTKSCTVSTICESDPTRVRGAPEIFSKLRGVVGVREAEETTDSFFLACEMGLEIPESCWELDRSNIFGREGLDKLAGF